MSNRCQADNCGRFTSQGDDYCSDECRPSHGNVEPVPESNGMTTTPRSPGEAEPHGRTDLMLWLLALALLLLAASIILHEAGVVG